MTILHVEFVGEEHHVNRGSSLAFGRLGDLALDTNPELPAVVGRFEHDRGLWWLVNQTLDLTLQVADRHSESRIEIAPEIRVPIGFVHFFVSLEVGRARYEMTLRVDEPPSLCGGVDSSAGRKPVSLNREQRQLLVVLAENVLHGAETDELPSNSAVAARLGWNVSKLNRKLDHLCLKFEKLGVAGLRGSTRRLATRRRHVLVSFCVSANIITIDDLKLLVDLDVPSAEAGQR